jgi:ubiquinone/menaquinone biosynthesis C-methylase UbiE
MANMKHTYSVDNKDDAIYYNRKTYDSEFGSSYDYNHNLSPNHYTQKIFKRNIQYIINKLSESKDGLTLIDIGTGTGSLSLNYYKFIRPSDTVVNLDISENMLNLLRKKLSQQHVDQSQFVADDAYAYLAITDLKFDLVGFAGCLHHFYDYQAVFEQACKKLSPNGYIYIALEPKHTKSYIEYTIRNFESVIVRFKRGEFGLLRLIIKILYTPFHFLNAWFGLSKIQLNSENFTDPDQQKSEVVTSGLDIESLYKTLKTQNIKVVNFSGGPDYAYFFTFKLLNLLHLNSHFQLIARKGNK